MPLIKFTRDFRGVITNEQYYEAGEVVDHPNAAAIVAEGAAEYVQPEPILTPEPTPAPTPAPKKRSKNG